LEAFHWICCSVIHCQLCKDEMCIQWYSDSIHIHIIRDCCGDGLFMGKAVKEHLTVIIETKTVCEILKINSIWTCLCAQRNIIACEHCATVL
jgi:hypothetical protein